MRHDTSDFAKLYEVVTARLEDFLRQARQRKPPVSNDDDRWLSYLIEVFRQLYDDWQIDPALNGYMSDLEVWPSEYPNPKKVHRLFRLAGHVYLHVAYDLTRGVLSTLVALDENGRVDLAD